jgi:hypothetical protein
MKQVANYDILCISFKERNYFLHLHFLTGHAMPQVISHWFLAVEGRVHAWVSACGIVMDKVALDRFFFEFFGFPVSIVTSLHHHSIFMFIILPLEPKFSFQASDTVEQFA